LNGERFAFMRSLGPRALRTHGKRRRAKRQDDKPGW